MKPQFKNLDKGMLLFTLVIVGIISALVVIETKNLLGSLILIIFAVIISPSMLQE